MSDSLFGDDLQAAAPPPAPAPAPVPVGASGNSLGLFGPELDQQDLSVGKSFWRDSRVPVEQRVDDYLASRAQESVKDKGTKWSDVWDRTEAGVRTHFPGVDPGALYDRFSKMTSGAAFQDRLQTARAREAAPGGEETPGEIATRGAIPFGSTLLRFEESRRYGEAINRVRQGMPQGGDEETIAEYEQRQKAESQEGMGKAGLRALSHLPGIVGEGQAGGAILKGFGLAPAISFGARAAAPAAELTARGAALGLAKYGLRTGIQTAAMPAMYLPEAAQRAAQDGGEWSDLKNLGPAAAMGVMQVAVLGGASHAGQSATAAKIFPALAEGGATGYLSRLFASVGTGVTGQQAIDAASSIIGWRTGYGVAGDILNGRDDALKHAFVLGVTFLGFGFMHAHNNPVGEARTAQMEQMRDTMGAYLDKMADQGYSRNAAGQEMLKIHLELGKQIRDGDFTGKLPENLSKAGREYSEKLASQMDTKGLAEEQAAKQNAPNAPESTPPASGQAPAEAETGAKAATPEPPAAGNARTPAEKAKTARDMATILEQQGQSATAAKLRAEAEQLDPTPRQRWTREEQQQVAKGLKMNAREFAELDPKIKAQLEAEVIAKRAPKAAPAAHDFGDLKPDEVQFLRKQGLTDAAIAKLAGQAKAPAEPNPQSEGLPVAERLFTEQFPGAKRHADGWYKATVGETDVFMEKGEAPNSVHIDFRDARGRAGDRTVEETAALNAKRAAQGLKPVEPGVGESLRTDTLKFLRPLREFIGKLKAEGKSIEYTAKGPGRQSLYAKALTKAGYEVVPELSDPDAPAPKFVWRPKAEVVEPNAQPAAKPAVAEPDPFAALAQHGVEVRPEPPNPHDEGLVPEPPRVPRGTERTPEQEAEYRRLVAEHGRDLESEQSPVRGRTEEGQSLVGVNSGLPRPGRQSGDGEVPSTIQEKISAANLSARDQLLIEEAFKGNSLRATMEKLASQRGEKMSPEGVRKAQQRILRKLGSDAATVEEWMASERQDAASQRAKLPANNAPIETAAKQAAADVPDHEVTNRLLEEAAQSFKKGMDPQEFIDNLLNSQEIQDAIESDVADAKRRGDSPEAVRREIVARLREIHAVVGARAEGEGPPATQQPPHLEGPRPAAPGEPGPARAPADAQATGDVVEPAANGLLKAGWSKGDVEQFQKDIATSVGNASSISDLHQRVRVVVEEADNMTSGVQDNTHAMLYKLAEEMYAAKAKPLYSPDQLLLQQRAAEKAVAKASAAKEKADVKALRDRLTDTQRGYEQNKDLKDTFADARAAYGERGVIELHDRADHLIRSADEADAPERAMLADARQWMERQNPNWRRDYEDHADVPHFGELAEKLAETGLLNSHDPADALWEKLTKPGDFKTRPDLYKKAFEWMQTDREVSDAHAKAVQSQDSQADVEAAVRSGEEAAGVKPGTPEGRDATAPAAAAEEPAEAGRGAEPEHFDPANLDFDVDTLGKPTESAGRPVRGVGAERPDVSDATLEAAEEFVKQEGGFVKPEAILARAYDLAARLGAAARFVQNNWREFAGNQFPRTARLSEGVAQKMAEWVHAKTAAIYGTPRYIDLVMGQLKVPAKTQLGRVGDAIRGQQIPQAARRMAGAVETEWRLEYMHDAYTKKSADLYAQADAILRAAQAKGQAPGKRFAELTTQAREARDDAAGVGTIISAQNSLLTSEAQYRAELAKPEHKDLQARWEKYMVPVMEANFRKAMGLDPTDPIDSFTQRPGHPINLKNLGPNDLTPSAVQSIPRGPSRGNLGNVRQGRLGFSRQAKGTGTYDIDLGAIIANSLGKGLSAASRAEALKSMIDAEIAHPGEPFKAKEGFTEFQNTFPQKGNALAEEGQTSLYVKADAAGEYRQALQVDEAPKYPLIAGFNSVLTRAALASSVEFVYHGKNLFTFLMKPGVRLPDLLKNAYDVVRNTPEAQARLFELAKMGRMKAPGMESGLLAPERFKSLDPTYHASRVLDGVQKVMRLTAEDAFDRMSGDKADLIASAVKSITGKFPFEKGELNKTNFINQLGQYNKRSQNSLLVLLRDTGISPFATAGTNYYVQSMRGLTGASGARTTGLGGEIASRGEYFAKAAAVLGTVAAINYLAWNRVDGDDKTPLGSIKVGENEGTQYLDLTSLTGLTRGVRQTGLLAYAEGERAGGKKGKITAEEDRAFNQIVSSLMHPFMGPGPQFLHTALTGHNSLGMDVRQPKMGDQSDMHRDITAAAWQANPAAETFRPDIQRSLGVRVSEKDEEARKPVGQRAEKLFGPFGIRTRK